ncbi:hypothetical protein [Actinomadura violacea]|uniref:Uncharacterized protein n=1 Tax=Actinomadura violacea TaxID=2819934 RepID=A0ABS3RXW4_9ACTN|nr:hypothetical protein [Actinomadura violacea]MBO2461606.1 hypothetical protein [Actinomadura violacea]
MILWSQESPLPGRKLVRRAEPRRGLRAARRPRLWSRGRHRLRLAFKP